MVVLFRIVEPCGGRVTIDGVDALRLGLQDLREAISIIPQVTRAVTFEGGVRFRTGCEHSGGTLIFVVD